MSTLVVVIIAQSTLLSSYAQLLLWVMTIYFVWLRWHYCLLLLTHWSVDGLRSRIGDVFAYLHTTTSVTFPQTKVCCCLSGPGVTHTTRRCSLLGPLLLRTRWWSSLPSSRSTWRTSWPSGNDPACQCSIGRTIMLLSWGVIMLVFGLCL